MKKRNRSTALLRTGMGFFAFASGATLVNGLFLPYASAHFKRPMPLMWAAFALTAAGFWALRRFLSRVDEARLARFARVAAPVFLAAFFVVQVALGYMMEYTPSGDNSALYNGAKMLARDGNFAAKPDYELYLSRYSNQWGFMLILTALFRLFAAVGISAFFMPLVILQAALHACGFASLLGMAKRICGVRGQLMQMALMAAFLPLYVAAGVLYTDTFSMPFVLLALDFALRACETKDMKTQLCMAALSGLFAMIGCQIKMTVAIVTVAAVIVFALRMKPVRAILCGALCAGLVFAGGAGVRYIMLTRVIDPAMEAQHHTPAIHWVMMSIPTGDNPYGGSTGDYGITWGMMERGATREEIMDSIYTRMKDRVYTLRYPNRLIEAALRKNSAQCDGTMGMTEMLDDGPVRRNVVSSFVLKDGAHYRLYGAICTGVYMAALAFAWLGCLRDIRKHDVSLALGYIAMFGVMLFLMIWEARSRYLFNFVPVLLLLACAFAAPKEGGKA